MFFPKSLSPCVLDNSSFSIGSIGRVIWSLTYYSLGFFLIAGLSEFNSCHKLFGL